MTIEGLTDNFLEGENSPHPWLYAVVREEGGGRRELASKLSRSAKRGSCGRGRGGAGEDLRSCLVGLSDVHSLSD